MFCSKNIHWTLRTQAAIIPHAIMHLFFPYMEQLTIMIPAFGDRLREIIGFDMVEVDKKIILAKDDFYDVLDELAQSLLK